MALARAGISAMMAGRPHHGRARGGRWGFTTRLAAAPHVAGTVPLPAFLAFREPQPQHDARRTISCGLARATLFLTSRWLTGHRAHLPFCAWEPRPRRRFP